MKARKITKPVISSDVMGNRNVEVRAVGAWVQPEVGVTSEGVIAAQEAEERMKQIQRDKEERLRRFRDDVKARVKLMETIRKQQELAKSYQATEHECKVVKQSAFSENLTPRKDNCMHRKHNALSINTGRPGSESCKDLRPEVRGFKDHSSQVHRFTSQARGRLVSKQIAGDSFCSDDCQDDVWRNCISSEASHSSKEAIIIPQAEEESRPETAFTEDDVDEEGSNDLAGIRAKMVQFDLDNNEVHITQNNVKKKKGVTQSKKTNQVPHIYMGVQTEEEKKQHKLQQATYRRLFMDIEREQVKENLRRKEHRKKIQMLKKEKEALRKQEEGHSRDLLEPRDPLTGESSLESLQREIEEHQYIREVMRENEIRLQKVKEMERFLEALKHQLKDKMDKKGVELAPLCCCGTSVWDTNPETCANNCVFYRNPKGYAKALQSLLVSSEIS